MRLKQTCQHLMVDSWHVPTQEACELVRARGNGGYRWRDHLRSELSGGMTMWMWPGLALVLALGIFIEDWWLIIGSSLALSFFLYQAVVLSRTLSSGQVVTARTQSITRTDTDGGEPIWAAVAKVDGVRRQVVVSCQTCIDALQKETSLELAVLVDPTDPGNHWLVGFREA